MQYYFNTFEAIKNLEILFHLTKKAFYFSYTYLIKTHFMFLAEQYNPENLHDNYIHYWVGYVNEEAKRKLLKVHKEFHKKVRKIMDAEDSKGDKLVFSLACNDSLLAKELGQDI